MRKANYWVQYLFIVLCKIKFAYAKGINLKVIWWDFNRFYSCSTPIVRLQKIFIISEITLMPLFYKCCNSQNSNSILDLVNFQLYQILLFYFVLVCFSHPKLCSLKLNKHKLLLNYSYYKIIQYILKWEIILSSCLFKMIHVNRCTNSK